MKCQQGIYRLLIIIMRSFKSLSVLNGFLFEFDRASWLNIIQKLGAIIRKAVDASLDAKVVTVDISTEKPYSTSEVGDWIAEWVAKN